MNSNASQLKGKIITGSLATFIQAIVRIGLSFFSVPLILKAVGKEGYGILILGANALLWSGIGNLGVSTAAIREFGALHSRGDTEEANRVFSTSVFFLVLLGIVLVFLVLKAMKAGIFSSILKTTTPQVDLLVFTGIVLGVLTIISQSVGGVLVALNRVGTYKMLAITADVVFFIGLVIYLYTADVQLVKILFFFTGAAILGNLLAFAHVNRCCPGISLNFHLISIRIFRELLFPSAGYLLLNITFIVIFYVDSLVITRFLGLDQVGPYDLMFKIYGVVKLVSASICFSLFPVSASLQATNDKTTLREIYFMSSQAIIFLVMPIIVIFALFGENIIGFWAGREMFAGHVTKWGFVAMCLVSSILKPAVSIIQGAGLHQRLALMSVLEAGLNLALSIILVQLIGLPGVIFATVLASVATTFWFSLFQIGDFTETRVWEMGKKIIFPVVLPATIAFAGGAAYKSLDPFNSDFLQAFFGSLVTGILYLFIAMMQFGGMSGFIRKCRLAILYGKTGKND